MYIYIYIYITRLASNEIFSPSNKIHREVGRAKDLSALRYNRTGEPQVNLDVMERKIEKSFPFAGIESLFSDRWAHSSVNIVAEPPQSPSSLSISPLAVTGISLDIDTQTVAGEVEGAQARCGGPRITLRLLRRQRGGGGINLWSIFGEIKWSALAVGSSAGQLICQSL